MLTSFFSTTKPINYLICFVVFAVLYIAHHLPGFPVEGVGVFLVKKVGLFILLLAIFWVLNFIAKRNKLIQKTSNITLVTGLYLLAIPQTLMHLKLAASFFLVLLALRRVLSLWSQIDIKQKIIDATLFVLLASLFYFWAIVFLILVYIAILFYVRLDYKNWLLPFAAAFILMVPIMTYALYTTGVPAFLDNYTAALQVIGFKELPVQSLGPLAIVALVIQLVLVAYLGFLATAQQRNKGNYRIIIATLITGLSVGVLLGWLPGAASLIFVAFPFAVMTTRFLESQAAWWLREALLWVLVALPFVQIFS